MNNITLAHIGGELVLVGGIVFYFHKKTTMLQQEILLLKKTQEEQSAIIEDLQNAVQQLGSMVVGLQRNARGQALASTQTQASVQTSVQAQAPVQQSSAPHSSGRHHKPAHHKSQHRSTVAVAAQQPAPTPLSTLGMMQSLLPAEQSVPVGSQGPVTFPPSRKEKARTLQAPAPDEDSGAETYDDRELDNELEPEYEQLGAERDCKGDTCKLLD